MSHTHVSIDDAVAAATLLAKLALTAAPLILLPRVPALLAALCLGYLLFSRPRRTTLDSRSLAVVTGGSRGLGSHLVSALRSRGCRVAILDVEPHGQDTPNGLLVDTCDVGNERELIDSWHRIVRDLGPPTILINNAAIVGPVAPIADCRRDTLERIFRVNTLAAFSLSQLFLQCRAKLIPREKSPLAIVTVSSVLGHLGAAGLAGYCASKAALLAFHASLEAELAGQEVSPDRDNPSIKCILVAPGQLDTAMFRTMKLHGWMRKFLGPVVPAERLAWQVVDRIETGSGGEIREPFFARWHVLLGLLPHTLRGHILRWSSLHQAHQSG